MNINEQKLSWVGQAHPCPPHWKRRPDSHTRSLEEMTQAFIGYAGHQNVNG